MKKNLFICISALLVSVMLGIPAFCQDAVVTVIEETGDGLTLELCIRSFEKKRLDGNEFQQITIGGCGLTKQTGLPAVAVRGVLVEVPVECNLDVSAESLEHTLIRDFVLAPSAQRTLISDGQEGGRIREELIADAAVYAKDALFPGRLAEVEYRGFLRDRHVAKLNLYPVQFNPAAKELVVHRRLRVRLNYGKDTDDNADGNRVWTLRSMIRKQAPFASIYASSLLNYSPARTAAGTGDASAAGVSFRMDASGPGQSPFAVKAAIEAEGIYKITYEALKALGLDLSGATNENLTMENQGREVAIYCSGEGGFASGDYILFYGKALKTLYSKQNIYWLYQGAGSGKRMPAVKGIPENGYAEQRLFKNTYYGEEDLIYEQSLPPNKDGQDHWLWRKLSIIETMSYDFDVTLENIDTSSGTCLLELTLKGETDTKNNPDHHTKVYINGMEAGDFTWNGQVEHIEKIETIPAAYFTDGKNTVTVEALDDTGSTVDSYFINRFSIEYPDRFVAENDSLMFANQTTGGVAFAVSGFSDSDLMIYDITDPWNVRRISDADVTPEGSGYTARFEDQVSGSSRYCTIAASGISTDTVLTVDEPSQLGLARKEIDYIIITHERFYDGIQELKRYRESRGLSVEVVKIQDIYDEFSHGIKDVQAIRDFLAHAYTNWHDYDHPEFVLLVGDATFDYRDDQGLYAEGKEDLVPTYMFQTDILGDTPTDNWLACVHGDDLLPDMIVGRLCVKTDRDLENIVSKIKMYEAGKLSVWSGNVILAADDEVMFESISNNLAALLPDMYNVHKVYVDEYDDIASATEDLVSKINAGAVLVNYTGHGHVDEWASPYLFHTPDYKGNDRDDIELLTNDERLTFVTIMNCLSGYFTGCKNDYAMAEDFVRAQSKGAIACFAPTSAGYPSEHQVLASKIFNDFFTEGQKVAGRLVTGAKIAAYSQISSRDMIHSFALFGDPATELKLVTESTSGEFELVSPENNEVLPALPLPLFTWGTGLYERFKVQFSTFATFPEETTVTVPLLPFLALSSDVYRPNMFIWAVLRVMSMQNGALYWRVVAYDDDFNIIENTNYRSFFFEE